MVNYELTRSAKKDLARFAQREGRNEVQIINKMFQLYEWYNAMEQKCGGHGERGRLYFASKEEPFKILGLGEFRFGNTREKIPYHFESLAPVEGLHFNVVVSKSDSVKDLVVFAENQ